MRAGLFRGWSATAELATRLACRHSLQARKHLGRKPLHLLAVLGDVVAERIEQNHLRAGVDDGAQPAITSAGVPDTGTASIPGIPPYMRCRPATTRSLARAASSSIIR